MLLTRNVTALWARFIRDRKGGVAPFLALSVIPVIAFSGSAVDYTRANAIRTAMQSALDSSALMLSKEAESLEREQLTVKTREYFNAQFKQPDATNIQVTSDLQSPQEGSFVLALTASASVKTVFATMLGKPHIDIHATAEAKWGIKKLNLALALDNTGSMSSKGKMAALKTAAHSLLDTLEKAAKTPGDVEVSIIPFATDVNIGTGNVNASWVRWTEWEAANGTCSNTYYKNKDNCTSAGKVWTPASHGLWNGCVMDRDQNYDTLSTAPLGSATAFPAHQASACSAPMMALSHDWSALHAKIDAMIPTGNTNVAIGLAHAWQTLASNAPYDAPSPAPDLDKVIIILTDGENTQNRWTSSTSAIDTRTEKVCDNIKADNVRIYSVRVINGNATLLKNCATNPGMYYDVDEASELNGVFSAIAQNLANLRLSR
jgi:Flp pilus assembly protein TadG